MASSAEQATFGNWEGKVGTGTLGREHWDGNVGTRTLGQERWDGNVWTGTLGRERRERWDEGRYDGNVAAESITKGTLGREC